MAKKYRKAAVKKAVENWKRSEWFSANDILDFALQQSTQPKGGFSVYTVSRFLSMMEYKGQITSKNEGGVKVYRRNELWDA